MPTAAHSGLHRVQCKHSPATEVGDLFAVLLHSIHARTIVSAAFCSKSHFYVAITTCCVSDLITATVAGCFIWPLSFTTDSYARIFRAPFLLCCLACVIYVRGALTDWISFVLQMHNSSRRWCSRMYIIV